MRAVFDNGFGPFAGIEPPQIGQSLLGDEYMDLVLRMVDMRDLGDDTGYSPVLRR